LQDREPGSHKIGQRGGEGEGSRVIGDHQIDPAPGVPFIEIGAGKPEKLAVPVDPVRQIGILTRRAGTGNDLNGSSQSVPTTAEGGGFQREVNVPKKNLGNEEKSILL
jgi:hypothetical protein